jgi:heme A synthase
VAIHLAHRYWAAVVAGMVILTTVKLFRLSGQSRRLMLFQYLLIALLVIQVTLGGFTVLSRKAVDLTTAHVATGALLLASSVLLTLHALKLCGIRSPRLAFLQMPFTSIPGEARA